jgi:glycosyltransferase involved in cell wall biosynthesis
MRLLFVGEDYPPLEAGGYAQLCYDLAHGLRQKGHEVTILCFKPDSDQPIQEVEPVIRELLKPIDFQVRLPVPLQQILWLDRRRQHNLLTFRRVLQDTQAEIVLFWPNFSLDASLMVEAEKANNLSVGYYVAGFSPTQPTPVAHYWQHPGQSTQTRLIKASLRPFLAKRDQYHSVLLALKHIMCVSEYERQRVIHDGVAPDNVIVIHNGIDPAQFYFRGLPSTRRRPNDALKVLYLGRLTETKGTHTLIEAIHVLRQTVSTANVYLTLLGIGDDSYVNNLDHTIKAHCLTEWIERRSWMPRTQIPEFMLGYDVLVLPTIHPEPLARVVQEAMAMGLVVVATPTGGTPEIVHDNITGLTFTPSNPAELANCLLRLYSDSELCDRLAGTAYELVTTKFTIQYMVDSVESQFRQWMGESV